MENFWIALGSLTGGGALVWSIFSFTVDRRDKAAEKERDRMDRAQDLRDNAIRQQLTELKSKAEKMTLELMTMKNLVALQNEKLNLYTETFHEEMKRLTLMPEQEQKETTSKFGHVIKVGVKK